MSTWPVMILSLGPDSGFWSKGRRDGGVPTAIRVSTIFAACGRLSSQRPETQRGLGFLPPSSWDSWNGRQEWEGA